MNDHSRAQELCGLLLILAAALLVCFVTVPLGWHHDDAPALHFLQDKNIWEFLTSPAIFQQSGSISFTPLLYVSLLIDWKLWSLNSWGYAIHNGASYVVLGFAALFFFRSRGLSQIFAAFSSAILLLLPSVVAVSAWASTRHYVEGMIWAFFSLGCVSYWLKKNNKVYLGFTLLGYFLAILSKEIYLPLILHGLILVRHRKGALFQLLLGYGLVLCCYFSLRIYLQGGMLHNSVELPDPVKIISYLLLSWPRFAALSVDLSFYGIKAVTSTLITHLVLFLSLFLVWKRRKYLGLIGYAALLLTTVVVTAPVLSDPSFQFATSHSLHGNRFIFPFAVVLFTLFFLLIFQEWEGGLNKKISHKSLIASLFCLSIVIGISGVHQGTEWSRIKLSHNQWERLFTLTKQPGVILVGPYSAVSDFGVINDLRDSKEKALLKTVRYFRGLTFPDTSMLSPRNLYIVAPGHPIVHARSRDEMNYWIRDEHFYIKEMQRFFTVVNEK